MNLVLLRLAFEIPFIGIFILGNSLNPYESISPPIKLGYYHLIHVAITLKKI